MAEWSWRYRLNIVRDTSSHASDQTCAVKTYAKAKLVIIVSGNCLTSVRCHDFTWTNVELLPIGSRELFLCDDWFQISEDHKRTRSKPFSKQIGILNVQAWNWNCFHIILWKKKMLFILMCISILRNCSATKVWKVYQIVYENKNVAHNICCSEFFKLAT